MDFCRTPESPRFSWNKNSYHGLQWKGTVAWAFKLAKFVQKNQGDNHISVLPGIRAPSGEGTAPDIQNLGAPDGQGYAVPGCDFPGSRARSVGYRLIKFNLKSIFYSVHRLVCSTL